MFFSILEPVGLRVPAGNLRDLSVFTGGCPCRRRLSTTVVVSKFVSRDFIQYQREMHVKTYHNIRTYIA
jgi:hypothetical protein